MSPQHKGHCLCGAVTVTTDALSNEISACHCDMCRRWSGSIQMGIEVPFDAVTISGPVKTHQSSRLAQRAWCDTCGSALWFRYTTDRDAGYFELAPGLYENAGGATLTHEVYADRCPDGYALAGDHDRVTQAEYEQDNPHVAPAADKGDKQ